jgi:tetratricopeptide (TPR) repeat protein
LWVVDARLRRGAEVGSWLAEAAPATPELAVEGALLAARAGLLTAPRADRLVEAADVLRAPRLSAEARLAVGLLVRGARGAALLREGLRFADRCPLDERVELEIRLLAGLVEVLRENGSGARPECRAVAAAAAEAARRAGSAWGEMDVELTLAALAADEGELDQALERLGTLARRAETLGHLGIARQALISRAGVLLRAGRLDDATRCARLAVTRSETVGGVPLGQALGLLAEAHARRGDHALAITFLDCGITVRGVEPGVALLWLRRASSLLALGRPDAARLDAERAVSLAEGRNADLEMRSRLWLAVHRAPQDDRELTLLIEACRDESSLRGPTRELLLRARNLLALGSRSTP